MSNALWIKKTRELMNMARMNVRLLEGMASGAVTGPNIGEQAVGDVQPISLFASTVLLYQSAAMALLRGMCDQEGHSMVSIASLDELKKRSDQCELPSPLSEMVETLYEHSDSWLSVLTNFTRFGVDPQVKIQDVLATLPQPVHGCSPENGLIARSIPPSLAGRMAACLEPVYESMEGTLTLAEGSHWEG